MQHIDNLREWYTRKKAIGNQLKTYRYMLEVHKITELFVTNQILIAENEGKGSWRNQLLQTQQLIKAHEAMINFLQTL